MNTETENENREKDENDKMPNSNAMRGIVDDNMSTEYHIAVANGLVE